MKWMSKTLTECRLSGVGTGMGVFATCPILKDQTVWKEEFSVHENRCDWASVLLKLIVYFANYYVRSSCQLVAVTLSMTSFARTELAEPSFRHQK